MVGDTGERSDIRVARHTAGTMDPSIQALGLGMLGASGHGLLSVAAMLASADEASGKEPLPIGEEFPSVEARSMVSAVLISEATSGSTKDGVGPK